MYIHFLIHERHRCNINKLLSLNAKVFSHAFAGYVFPILKQIYLNLHDEKHLHTGMCRFMLETVHFTVIYMIYDNHKFFWTIKTRKLTPQNIRKSDDDDVATNLRYIL